MRTMYQGMTEAIKSTLLGELQSIESGFCYEFRFDYDENLIWEKDYIYESLFAPIVWESFSWDSSAIQVWLEDLRDVSYSAKDTGWTVDSVMEFESRVEILAEKALEESKIYRIEWED